MAATAGDNNSNVQGIGGGVQGMLNTGNALSADNMSDAMASARKRLQNVQALGSSAPEAIELRRAQQPARRFEALRPDRSRAQRLVRLGPVGWNGAELEETQTGFWIEFVLLVAVRQRAVFHLEPAREAVRQEVLDS